jgi:hypothetical protein
MQEFDWTKQFRKIYERGTEAYRAGKRKPSDLFDAADTAGLASIGCSPQELFDFIDDLARRGEPDFETVLLITAARRDYFITIQHRKHSTKLVDMAKLPAKSDDVAGIPWLPRIIVKARAKLAGEMPAELMYCCGGDIMFLKEHKIHPADFLREVWGADGDDKRIIEYVKDHKAR